MLKTVLAGTTAAIAGYCAFLAYQEERYLVGSFCAVVLVANVIVFLARLMPKRSGMRRARDVFE